MFCKKCGSLMNYDDGKLVCSCGYSEKGELVVKDRKKDKKKIEIVEKFETHPIIKAECPKCKHDKACSWSLQTRSSDEPETIFHKCVKCGHQWREYD